MKLFLAILIVVFSFSQKTFAGDMQGFMNAMEKAKDAGFTLDLDATAKEYGYKNFEKVVREYFKVNNVTNISIDEAKEFFLGVDRTTEIVQSQENLDKLYSLIMNDKYFKKKNTYLKTWKKGKYKKNSISMMALAAYINYEKEMSKISKNPNLKKVSRFTWGWGYSWGSGSDPYKYAIEECEKDVKKNKLSGGECIIVDFRNKRTGEIINRIKPIEIKKLKESKVIAKASYPDTSSKEIIDFKICKNIRDKNFAYEMFDFYNYKIDLKNNTVLLDYAYTDEYIEIKKNKGEKPPLKKQSLSYIILENKNNILITDLSKHTFREISDKLTINLQTNTVKVDAYLKKNPMLSVVQSCQRNIDIAKKIKLKISTNEKYYALVIGNNNYEHLEKLDAAENDAEVIADVLTNKYGFEVDLLLNANYEKTVDTLFQITNKLKRNDNLLIYYAGHGELDKAENRGYWLPVDASYEQRSKWISNQRIVDRIKATKAKHVLLIADSCFSGTLMRSGITPEANEAIDEKYIERLKSKKTRLVITSGGNEPVVDSDGGNHSLFALKLIDTLKNNNTVINSQMLFENIRRYVVSNADQTPERALVHKTGHDGGDFLFFPKE